MERTTSVWSDRNIRDQLWKRLPLSIWQNHRSFESCFTYNARWLGSGIIVPLGTWNSENISAWQAKKLVGMGKEERWKRKVRARGKGKGAPSLPLSHQSPHFYPSFHSLPFYAGYERFFVACDGEVWSTSGEAARINLWRRAPWFTVLDGPWPCL